MNGLIVDKDLKVLLVEDSKLIHDRLIELILELDGVIPVGTVTTEAEAICFIDARHPDAIVLDLRLKEGTGFGVLHHINTMSIKPSVIVITNYALPQYRQQAQFLGARFFVDKTQDFEQITDALKIFQEEQQYH